MPTDPYYCQGSEDWWPSNWPRWQDIIAQPFRPPADDPNWPPDARAACYQCQPPRYFTDDNGLCRHSKRQHASWSSD